MKTAKAKAVSRAREAVSFGRADEVRISHGDGGVFICFFMSLNMWMLHDVIPLNILPTKNLDVANLEIPRLQ